MKICLALALCVLALPARAGDVSHYVDELSCSSGPYALRLPGSLDALRRIGALRGERLVREENLGPYTARYRDLLFNGLRLGVVTYSNDPDKYEVLSAEIRSSQWRIAGPLRAGQLLPAMVGDVPTRQLSSTSTVEFTGDEDTLRVRLVGRRVSTLTYLCVAD